MTTTLRIGLAQLNLIVGDIHGNLKKHLDAVNYARDQQSADILVFPELSITGYPPEDLLLRKAFIAEADMALNQFISTVKNIYCVVSHPLMTNLGLYNACSLIYNGKIIGQYSKQYLPNYGVFDENRYFIPGNAPCVVPVKGIPVGLVICEDLWFKEPMRKAYEKGARLILSPNASPFEVTKHEQRLQILKNRITENPIPIIYVNNVGGQDELVFDGGSMMINEEGNISEFAGFFNETLCFVDVDVNSPTKPKHIVVPSTNERIYQTLVVGLRDYINKNHIPGVLVGVSGGIDSALVLSIAVDALGKDRVKAIMMPSRYTADISKEDANIIINNLGVAAETISIEPTFKQFLTSLEPSFAGKKLDVTEENIQARCRAIILMALSNKSGYLVLTTGNRSEIAVGYCTLYGDMAGGFGVLKDVPKTLVYELAKYRNQTSTIIPERTLHRAPTAELAPNQKDEDTLPPYPLLDRILEAYLNQGLSIDEIIAQGFDANMVTQVIRLVKKNEYKRRQAAIGTHINHRSFGKDWRYPITNGFKG